MIYTEEIRELLDESTLIKVIGKICNDIRRLIGTDGFIEEKL